MSEHIVSDEKLDQFSSRMNAFSSAVTWLRALAVGGFAIGAWSAVLQWEQVQHRRAIEKHEARITIHDTSLGELRQSAAVARETMITSRDHDLRVKPITDAVASHELRIQRTEDAVVNLKDVLTEMRDTLKRIEARQVPGARGGE